MSWHVRFVPIADIWRSTRLNWLVADQTDPFRVNQGMRRALLFVLLLTLTLAPAEARRHGHHHGGLWGFLSMPHAHRHGHRHHREVARRHTRGSVRAAAGSDSRGTYTVADLVPPDWQLQPTDPNLKGQRFVSADGAAWLALFATPAEQQPIAKHMNAVAFVDGEQITHLHGEENSIEVSGLKADRSFYRKAVLACAGRVWHEVAFEYPTQTQGSISEFVNRAAKAVENSEGQGCEDSASPTVGDTPAPEVPTAPSSSSNN